MTKHVRVATANKIIDELHRLDARLFCSAATHRKARFLVDASGHLLYEDAYIGAQIKCRGTNWSALTELDYCKPAILMLAKYVCTGAISHKKLMGSLEAMPINAITQEALSSTVKNLIDCPPPCAEGLGLRCTG